MKVDLTLSATGPVDQRAAAEEAEHAGYDGVWAAEVKHDPFLALGLAATVTERAELGTAIALAFARNPMSVASLGHDLQAVSRGRLILGLGTQVKAHVTRRFSMPWSHPAPRMREFVLAMRAIWDCWNNDVPLGFRGEFYSHTLMTPMFTPHPHPYGPPRVLLAGVGETMTEAAGEVADGFLCHGFTTERYLREVTLPALRRGRRRTGGVLDGFEVAGNPLIVTGRTEEELIASGQAVRRQIAFYGSTPAYRPVLELQGWGALGDELHRLSREGHWPQMGELVDDEVLNAFAVVGEPDHIAPELLRRYGDLLTRLTLYTPYDIDAQIAAQVANAVRTSRMPAG